MQRTILALTLCLCAVGCSHEPRAEPALTIGAGCNVEKLYAEDGHLPYTLVSRRTGKACGTMEELPEHRDTASYTKETMSFRVTTWDGHVAEFSWWIDAIDWFYQQPAPRD